MCKYCEGNNQERENLFETVEDVAICIWNDQFRENILIDDGTMTLKAINFCPICGRYLKGKEIQERHDLKILPEYFNLVKEGKKRFEIRKDDRGYKEGDIINLKEFDGTYFTGKEVQCKILYKLDGGQYGLKEGYCILSIELI